MITGEKGSHQATNPSSERGSVRRGECYGGRVLGGGGEIERRGQPKNQTPQGSVCVGKLASAELKR